ncbi:nucleotide disphospho-sugar-binding domain-containing protein [Micromonosporaceae bacterium B7E4]
MRVLITVPPAKSHLLPLVPLAWSLIGHGHEVLVASASSAVPAAVAAGLRTVDVAPDADFDAVFGVRDGTPAERAADLRRRGEELARNGGATTAPIFERFAQVSGLMAAGTLAVAELVRPDLVVTGRLQGAGLLVGSRFDVPVVEHGVGLVTDPGHAGRFLPHLSELYAAHGVPLEPPQLATLHIAPPEIMVGGGRGVWNMRFVAYNGGGELPGWAGERARPRVVVTLGTVLPRAVGVDGLGGVLKALAQVDAEVVLLGSGMDALGPLPANVRAERWLPLSALLEVSNAIVHHGGGGTALNAINAGIPQLAIPFAADEFVNADVISRHRLGLAATLEELDGGLLERVLHDPGLSAGARWARERSRACPVPGEMVGALAAWAR